MVSSWCGGMREVVGFDGVGVWVQTFEIHVCTCSRGFYITGRNAAESRKLEYLARLGPGPEAIEP